MNITDVRHIIDRNDRNFYRILSNILNQYAHILNKEYPSHITVNDYATLIKMKESISSKINLF